MNIINNLLTEYCQLFGYASCSNLSLVEILVLAAIAIFVIAVIFRLLRWIFKGI
jgi:hypothetical protein